MRPNDLHSWYCVFNSLAIICRHAAQLRMQQAAACLRNSASSQRRRIDGSAVAIGSQVGYKDGSIVNPQSRKTSRLISTSLYDGHASFNCTPPHVNVETLPMPGRLTENNYAIKAQVAHTPVAQQLSPEKRLLDPTISNVGVCAMELVLITEAIFTG
jgi:hypothetical protein